MPGAITLSEPFCIVARRVGGQLGPYSFTPNRKKTVPLKWAMMRNTGLGPNAASPHGVENERLEGLEQIAFWAMHQEPGPVMVLTSQVPEKVVEPLMMAGQKYVDDLAQNCTRMIFCPHLYYEDESLSGAILELGNYNREEVEPWEGGRFNLRQTLFLNFFDPQGQPFSPEEIGLWGIASLLGHMALNAKLIAKGLAASDLSDQARAVFTRNYHRAVVQGLEECQQLLGGIRYVRSSESARFIAQSEMEVSQIEPFLTPRDAEILASL